MAISIILREAGRYPVGGALQLNRDEDADLGCFHVSEARSHKVARKLQDVIVVHDTDEQVATAFKRELARAWRAFEQGTATQKQKRYAAVLGLLATAVRNGTDVTIQVWHSDLEAVALIQVAEWVANGAPAPQATPPVQQPSGAATSTPAPRRNRTRRSK